MSWRLMVIHIMDIVLRVPPLFVLDSILNGTILTTWIPESYVPHSQQQRILFAACCLLLITLVSGASVVIISLSTEQLFIVYSVLLSSVILFLSYSFNQSFIAAHFAQQDNLTTRTEDVSTSYISVKNLIVQYTLACCYKYLSVYDGGNVFSHLPQAATYVLFLNPVALSLLPVPVWFVRELPWFSVVVLGLDLLLVLLTKIADIVHFLHSALLAVRVSLRNFGMHYVINFHWERLHVPSVLRVFWLLRSASHFIYYFTHVQVVGDGSSSVVPSTADTAYIAAVQTLSGSCDNWIALFSLCSVVSWITQYADSLFLLALGVDARAEHRERQVGTTSSVLFVILALQTGLTSLPASKRLIRLYRNMCLMVTALLHFGHEVVHERLMRLSAGQSTGVAQHIRILIACIFLIMFPFVFVASLWIFEPSIDTWLLAITVLGIEIVIKVIVSLIVYLLFMADSWRSTFWDRLDDYIYYVQSTGSTLEFLFGVFLFGNGAWILVFESGGTVRALMMCLHAYFNIWVPARRGWQNFTCRLKAAKMINLLPLATEYQLERHADVCAICYQELHTACITSCGHFFHTVCLRKWLYVQDVCPLCHQPVVSAPVATKADRLTTE